MSEVINIHKGDIAIQLLKDARQLYNDQHYFSAINLAGAASEILCTLCELDQNSSPHKELKKALNELYTSNKWMSSPEKMLKDFYWAKNATKHLSGIRDTSIVINPKIRACLLINQAARAAQNLNVTDNFEVEYESKS